MQANKLSNAYSVRSAQKLVGDVGAQLTVPGRNFPGPQQYVMPGDYLAPEGAGSEPLPAEPTPGALTALDVYRQYTRVTAVGKVLNFRQNDMFQQKYTAWKNEIGRKAGVTPYDPPNLQATRPGCDSAAITAYINMEPLAPVPETLAQALVHDVGLPPTKYIADESKGFLQKPTCINYAIPQLHAVST